MLVVSSKRKGAVNTHTREGETHELAQNKAIKLLAQPSAGKQMAGSNQPRGRAAVHSAAVLRQIQQTQRGCSMTVKLTIAMLVIVHARVPLMIVSLTNLPLEGACFGLGGQLVKWLYIAS